MMHEAAEGPVSEAALVVKTLRERGFQLEVVGDQVHVRPASRLTEEERCAIRRLKREIVATLPPQTVTTVTTVTPSQEQGDVDALVELLSTWPRLLGTLPLTAQQVIDDLSHVTGEAGIDADASRCRAALLALTGATSWPPAPPALAQALERRQDRSAAARLKRCLADAPADADLAEVLALVEKIRAVRPLGFLDDLERLARGYHQRGERDLLAGAVQTARRVAENVGAVQVTCPP
jgi:hypothetical protein